MGAVTAISWTDRTFNPWWGCSRVSPGCENCYAETFSKRVGLKVWGKGSERRFFGAKHWAQPLTWNRKAGERGVRERVFCASMADVFEDRRDLDDARAELWSLIELTPNLDWQLLTKRPENVRRLVPEAWVAPGWPWPVNAWLGVTVEDAQRAEERIPELLCLPVPVKFLSCEPLLGPLMLPRRWLGSSWMALGGYRGDRSYREEHRVGWVIVGGESGPKHRPLEVQWAVDLANQCLAAGVPVFVKQAGGARPGLQGDLPDWLWAMKEFPVSPVPADPASFT